MQVGTTKDQGLYNEPSAAVHPGALAAGTLPQYRTIPLTTSYKCLSDERPLATLSANVSGPAKTFVYFTLHCSVRQKFTD